MANKNMTRAQALEIAIASFEDSNIPAETEALAVLRKMYEQVIKPKAKSSTKSKTRLENEALARSLYEIAPSEPFEGKYVMEHTTAMSPQKVVGIMKVGAEMGLFERVQDGKKVLYRKIVQ